jgi:protein-tyrosine phosphatase/membrane-associated phospholipid phosphatase
MMRSTALATSGAVPHPWRRGLVWLLFLGPFFFLSYGFANWLTARRAISTALFFAWERQIPFLAWTIAPYWSIDLLYGVSLLTCRDRRQVDRLALRLLSAQLIAVTCFVLFPLRFAFARPETTGLFGAMFDLLTRFDQPYNQAPSLHVALLMILWGHYASLVNGAWRILLHGWFFLIGLSVLTTYQHHFIDLPTGLLAGLLCLWLWPAQWPTRQPSPLAGLRLSDSPVRRRLALAYLAGAGMFALTAIKLGGGALWLFWGSAALALVAANYAAIGPAGFQKWQGRLNPAASLLFAPYWLGAWLNSRVWTHRHPGPAPIADGVWLGRMPTRREMQAGGFAGLCDLSAELPAPRGPWRYINLPWLDLVTPTAAQLANAARQIESLRKHGPVLVCCALGYGRSAAAVAAWLLHSGRAADPAAAYAMIRARRPGVAFSPACLHAVASACEMP